MPHPERITMSRFTDQELLHLSALDQARAIREGDVSSVYLTHLYLSRIQKYNDSLHAFVNVQTRQARKAAKKADRLRSQQKSETLPIFHGVPIGIKDLVPTRWSFTHLGSRAYRYFISPFDAPVATRIKAGGFVSLGKLATSEFGVMPVTEPDIHPPTRNPWDLNRTSGGSSGGSSTAVAAHLLPIAHGSDGGGSVRIPSALTHLYGFKPSLSLLGNLHGEKYNQLGISVMGPLARYVEDAAAMLDVMAGRPGQDAGPQSCLTAARKMPPSLRIRLLIDTPLGQIDPEILSATRSFADTLRSLGHQVDEGSAPQIELDEFLPIWQYTVSGVKTVSDRYIQSITRWVRERGQEVTLEHAETRRRQLALRVEKSFADADILMSPTVPCVAPLIGSYSHQASPKSAFSEAAQLGSLTAGFNLTQGPAASLPIGLSKTGLPIGLQIGSYPGKDHLILSLSRQIEKVRPWHDRDPTDFI